MCVDNSCNLQVSHQHSKRDYNICSVREEVLGLPELGLPAVIVFTRWESQGTPNSHWESQGITKESPWASPSWRLRDCRESDGNLPRKSNN